MESKPNFDHIRPSNVAQTNLNYSKMEDLMKL